MKPIIRSELTFEVADYRVLNVEWRVFLGGFTLNHLLSFSITLDHQEIESTKSRMGLLPFYYCVHACGRKNNSSLKTMTIETICRYCYWEDFGAENESFSVHGKDQSKSKLSGEAQVDTVGAGGLTLRTNSFSSCSTLFMILSEISFLSGR